MCTPKVPKQEVTTPAAPAETPQPLASPDSGAAMNLSQLRLGSKNNLKLRSQPSSGLTLGSPS